MLRPERRFELVHRRCWSEPDLSWVWFRPGLVLVAAWLPRVTGVRSNQYYPVTSGRHFWADWFWYWLIIFFLYNEKVCLQKKRLSWHKPSYTVNRKFCRNLTWNKLANDADIYTAAVQLVYNPSVESSNQLGTILTIKHLEVQLQDLPTYYGLNQDTNVVGQRFISRWLDMCLCAWRYCFNKPFPDYATGKDNYTFYEPNQFVLGHGTWLEGWQIYQTNDILKVRDAGTVGISQVPDTSAGNNMRIRVPLSKKLNPGDAIYMIYYVVHTPNLQNASVTGCSSVVKYASKAN